MNYKQDRVNLFLYELQLLSKMQKIDEKQVYLQLINYDIPENERLKDLSSLFSIIVNKYQNSKKIEIVETKYQYCLSDKTKLDSDTSIKIHVPLGLNNIEKSVSKIIDFLIKSKVQHNTKLSKISRIDTLIIEVSNQKDADKITSFINSDKEISNNMYNPNPLYVTDEKLYLTSDKKISYNEILTKYLYQYILLCNEEKKEANIEDFKQFVHVKMIDFISKNDLSGQISLLEDRSNLPESLKMLKSITTTIYFNLQDIQNNKNPKEMFYANWEKANSNEEKDQFNDFTIENLELDRILLKEIITTMSHIYGYDDTKKALLGYKNSGKILFVKDIMYASGNGTSYITEKNGLRERVKKSKTFRSYINLFSDEELEKEFERLKPDLTIEEQGQIKTEEEMILEQVCKETYLVSQTEERNYSGKRQVAVALIRMQNYDYGYVTRTNEARAIAKKYIKPEEVLNIVKKSLETNGYIIENEEELYELYATHIEYLCSDRIVKKGRN